jgi:SAM-dependent methyltransferase
MKKKSQSGGLRWDYVINHAVETDKLAASRQYRRQLLLQKATEWGIHNEQGKALKTDLWNEAIGHDDLVEAIVKANSFCCGVDLSREVTRAAHLRYRRSPHSPRVSFILADLRFLPFRDNTFDSEYSPSTLDHLPTRETLRALRELRRTLKPSGAALISIDNLLCLWLYPLLFRLFLSRVSQRMWWPLSLWESERLLRCSGLRIERRDSILLAPTVGGVLLLA